MSTTQTQTVQLSRTYDYLLDPNFTTSGVRDFARHQARAQAAELVQVPNFDNMFSEVQGYQAHDYAFKMARHQPVSTTGGGTIVSESVIRARNQPADVGGRERHRFFRRPVVAYQTANQVMLKMDLQPVTMDTTADDHQAQTMKPQTIPKTRTVGTQSLYRESEAQTDPYTPDYYVPPGNDPEILSLLHLSFKNGLPAGLKEVEMIERLRLKREWEKNLPPLAGAEAFEERKRMMEEMELVEWAEREREINELQDRRMELLKQAVREKEETIMEHVAERLDRLWQKKTDEKSAKFAQIEHRRIKAMRKLMEERKQIDAKKPSIIQRYSDYSSEVYAPKTMHGGVTDRKQALHNTRIEINTVEALNELERSMPTHLFEPRIARPDIFAKPRTPSERRAAAISKQLETMDKSLRMAKQKKEVVPDSASVLEKHRIERPPPRPPTPSVSMLSEAEDARSQAAILLQRLIRGRAVQCAMAEGKERRMALITEMRRFGTEQAEEEMQQTLKKTQVLEAAAATEDQLSAVTENTVGAVVGQALDELAKHLQRAREERRIAAMVKLAERSRRIREAVETGMRAEEEERRKREDERFRQVMGVHQATVDAYLQDIIINAGDEVSREEARRQVANEAEQLASVTLEMESRPPEDQVRSLVMSFLIPEVEKVSLRARVQDRQVHCARAAAMALGRHPSSPTPSDPSSDSA